MRTILKVAVVVIVAILLSASTYVLFFTDVIDNGEADDEAPTIDTITGDTTGTTGKITTVSVTFSDNVEVTGAILYYKTVSASDWSSTSILNRSVDLSIPSDSDEDWYYYVTIDDAAGNGPVGDPSTDGSVYYTITISEGNEELVHTVFIEEGTQTTCEYCPWVGDALYEIYNSGEYDLYYVAMIDDENDVAKTRLKDEYNINAYPTIFVDGGYRVYRGGLYNDESPKQIYERYIEESLSRNVPKIKIEINSEYDNNTSKITTNVLINNYEENDYSGRLKVYLTEKISRWNDYNGSKYHFGFLDYITNKDVSVDKNSEEEIQGSYDATDLDPANLMITAVLFNSESHQGYAYPPDGNPFDAYYADACDATEVIEGGNLPPEVGITFPQQGQVYFRGRPALKIPVFVINYLRNTSTLKYTFLFGKTTITAYAEDDSSVERVEFYLNDELVYNDTEEPYEFGPQKIILKKPLIIPKKYEIMVKAIDDEGKSSFASIEVFAWRAFVY